MKINIASDQFLQSLKSSGLSPHTTTSYKRALKLFEDHLRNKEVERITIDDIESFRDLMVQRYQNTRSANARVIAVRSFIKYLNKKNLSTLSPHTLGSVRCPNTKNPVNLPTREELTRYLAPTNSHRDDLIVHLFYNTGLRLAELRSLNIEDLKREMKITGKGKKDRVVFINDKVYQMLLDYLSQEHRVKGPLFDITPTHINRIVSGRAHALGIDKKVTPHTLRHLYATHLSEAGVDIRVIQQMLGHSSLATTEIYTHVSVERMREAHKATDAFVG